MGGKADLLAHRSGIAGAKIALWAAEKDNLRIERGLEGKTMRSNHEVRRKNTLDRRQYLSGSALFLIQLHFAIPFWLL